MIVVLSPLQVELVQKELHDLLYLSARHRRWAIATDDPDAAKFHRHLAEEIESLCSEMERRFIGAHDTR